MGRRSSLEIESLVMLQELGWGRQDINVRKSLTATPAADDWAPWVAFAAAARNEEPAAAALPRIMLIYMQ